MRDMHATSTAARPVVIDHDRSAPVQAGAEMVRQRDRDPSKRDTTPSAPEAAVPVFADPASQSLAKLLTRIAPSDIPVMIRGDGGTGKGTVAQHLHRLSGRTGPLVQVDCTALAHRVPETGILASPVSATARCEDWLESARHGTLFLDEIAALPTVLQGRLLGALQSLEAAGAHEHHTGPADVRLVAATSIDLDRVVSAGHFRLELLCRLNVGQVRLLPLRQRRGDVAALAVHFLRIYAARLNVAPPLLSPQSLAALDGYSWPGNVRELESVIRCALLTTPGSEVRTDPLRLPDLPGDARISAALPAAPLGALTHPDDSAPTSLRQLLTPLFQTPGECLLKDLESQIVAEAFHFTGRNQVRTAELLGISRNVLRTLLRKHGVFLAHKRVMRR